MPGYFARIASANALANARSGFAGLAPDEVGERRVGEAARHRLVEAVARLEEALDRALAGEERLVVVVDVRGDEVGRFGIGARQHDRRDTHAVCGEACRDELLDRLARRHEHLAAHVSALLDGSQLILEVHARGAGLDHRLHQLEGVQHAAEARFRIGDDRREEIDVALAFHVLDLVGANERVVDPAHDLRHRIDRIERLVGIHLAGDVRVGGDLPSGKVDGLESGLHLLQRLVARQRTQRGDERLVLHQLPELLGAAPRERVLDVDRAAQADDVLGGVTALDALPAGILGPVLLEPCCFKIVVHGCSHLSSWPIRRPPLLHVARASGTLVSGPRSKSPSHAVPQGEAAGGLKPPAPHCTVRRGSLDRKGGHGWGGTQALACSRRTVRDDCS